MTSIIDDFAAIREALPSAEPAKAEWIPAVWHQRIYDAIREALIANFANLAAPRDRNNSAVAAADPLAAIWAERNRLDALARKADNERREDDRDELDDQRWAIEEKMPSIHAITISGVLAQVELLQSYMDGSDVHSETKTLLWTVHAGLLEMQAREVQP